MVRLCAYSLSRIIYWHDLAIYIESKRGDRVNLAVRYWTSSILSSRRCYELPWDQESVPPCVDSPLDSLFQSRVWICCSIFNTPGQNAAGLDKLLSGK